MDNSDIPDIHNSVVKKSKKSAVKKPENFKEIRKIKKCLKDKDKRISDLEEQVEYFKDHSEDNIKWFNVSTYTIFLLLIAVELFLTYFFFYDIFMELIVPIGVVGFVIAIINQIYCGYAMAFEPDDDDIGFVLFSINIIGFPVCLLFAYLFKILFLAKLGG